LIQQGDALSADKPEQALTNYTSAQTALQRFQRIYPGWNPRIVNFRLNYLESKITIIAAKVPGATVPAPVVPAPPPPTQTERVPVTITVPPAPPAQAPPVVQPPAVPPPPSISVEIQNQLNELQNQLKQLQNEKFSLEAKLREALAARPASADPRELALAQEKIRSMQKENDLLQVSLEQERTKVQSLSSTATLDQVKKELTETKRLLAEQTDRATKLAQENEFLQTRVKTLTTADENLASLRSENEVLKKLIETKPAAPATPPPAPNPDVARQLAEAQARIAALESDKEIWRLEKIALQNRVKQLAAQPAVAATPVWSEEPARVKQLERERDDLQKKLDAAQKELYGRNAKATSARVDQLAGQLENLRARLEVFESKPVPYSTEELALFKKPDVQVTDPRAGKKSVKELPAGTVELVASAHQDFAAGKFNQAEEKYLQVLRHDDKNVNTLANLAAIQLELNHFDEAEKHIKAALAVAPNDAYSLSILGNLKFRQEKYDDALDALSRAAKSDPQNAEVQNFLGLTLSQKGLRGAAETAFRKAIILNPNYAAAQNNLAVFYLTQKPPSLELARWHYAKAIAAGFPHNPEMEKMLEEKNAAEPSP
jgi:tetratricopeptide (TPR) repeat protein